MNIFFIFYPFLEKYVIKGPEKPNTASPMKEKYDIYVITFSRKIQR